MVESGSVPGYGPIFNAGVILTSAVFHLFARGVRDGYRRNPGSGPRFLDYVSDVLVFTSSDGFDYDSSRCSRRGSPRRVHCLEDPRVQRVEAAAPSTW